MNLNSELCGLVKTKVKLNFSLYCLVSSCIMKLNLAYFFKKIMSLQDIVIDFCDFLYLDFELNISYYSCLIYK